MASSSHNQQQQQQLLNMYGTTAAPPPTPSTQPNNIHLSTSTAAAADALSSLLHRLPPTLSLPTTRRSPPATCPTLISLSDDTNPNDHLLSSASQHGFFQLTNHSIPSQLAHSAELESLSLFALTKHQKQSYFPKNWPLGFDSADDEDGDGYTESFCMDSTCSNKSNEFSLSCLREFTLALEKIGLKIIEMIASAVGFENPIGGDPTRFCSLMWVSEGLYGEKQVISGGFYPYIVGLQYQIRSQKYSLLADSGWVSVSPQVDSIMVTLGDIAQVWSNGKLKKVRGRPVPCLGDSKNSRCMTMSLLVTLPTDSDLVSPLIPKVFIIDGNENAIKDDEEQNRDSNTTKKEQRLFNSFSFEDYAWRVYHERLLFKDPLDRYRI